MKIDYKNILKKNMLNVLKDVLQDIEINGLKDGHHLYITIDTKNKNLKIPKWLKEKYKDSITIVIQYEYWNFKVKKNSFNISLSFNDVRANLIVPYESVISFADPYANFGLKLIQDEKAEQINDSLKEKNKILDFSKYKKN